MTEKTEKSIIPLRLFLVYFKGKKFKAMRDYHIYNSKSKAVEFIMQLRASDEWEYLDTIVYAPLK